MLLIFIFSSEFFFSLWFVLFAKLIIFFGIPFRWRTFLWTAENPKMSICQNVKTGPARIARTGARAGTGGNTRISRACRNAG